MFSGTKIEKPIWRSLNIHQEKMFLLFLLSVSIIFSPFFRINHVKLHFKSIVIITFYPDQQPFIFNRNKNQVILFYLWVKYVFLSFVKTQIFT